MFRRRRADSDEEFDETVDRDAAGAVEGVDGDDLGDPDGRSRTVLPAQPSGPWDRADLPADDAVDRVDLGGLMIPMMSGIDLQVQVEDEAVVAVALVEGGSQLVVNAFAAPKTAGIWDEVRKEILDSLRSSGGSAEETTGGFGAELRARVPDGNGGTAPARFIGVDGPRWFLRGLMTGAGASDSLQARRLDEAFRGIVVVRGTDAMAPRDPLPLRVPREAMEQMANPEDRVLGLTERGPEITETQ